MLIWFLHTIAQESPMVYKKKGNAIDMIKTLAARMMSDQAVHKTFGPQKSCIRGAMHQGDRSWLLDRLSLQCMCKAHYYRESI